MKTFDLINKQNTTGMSLAQRANMELSDPMVNNNMNNIQDFELNPSVNTFSDIVSESGAGIYGSQNQRQQSVGYPSNDGTPLLQTKDMFKSTHQSHSDNRFKNKNVKLATKADSTFVKKHHPTFTKGYMSKSWDDFKNSEKNSEVYRSLDKPTKRSWNETTIQANKFDEKKAIKLANDKKIDTKYWSAKNKGIQL